MDRYKSNGWRVKEEADRRKWQNSSNEVLRTPCEFLLSILLSSSRIDVVDPQRVPNALDAYHCEITVLELPSVHRKSVLV